MSERRLRAEDLVRTEAECAALQALRAATGESDGPMERHGLRVHLIVQRLAARRGIDVDGEVTLCAALLHDAGGYPGVFTGGPYVTDGRRLAREVLEPFGWEPERLRLCLDAVELHHRLTPQWSRGTEVELLRRADQVELAPALGARAVGLGWLRGLARALPRRGLYREVVPIVTRSARAGSLHRIFVVSPGGGT